MSISIISRYFLMNVMSNYYASGVTCVNQLDIAFIRDGQ